MKKIKIYSHTGQCATTAQGSAASRPTIVHSPLSIIHCQLFIVNFPLIILLLFATGAYAQRKQQAPLTLQAEQTEAVWLDTARLQLSFLMPIPANAVSSDYRLAGDIYLIGEGDSLALAPVDVRGKLYQRKLNRARVLAGEAGGASADRYLRPGDTLRYDALLTARESWMTASPLRIAFQGEREGCCEVQPLPAMPLLAVAQAPAPPPPPMPEPVKPTLGDQLAQEDHILQHISQYRPFDPDEPLRRMPDAKIIYFELNDTVINVDFRQNRRTLDEVVELTERINNDSTSFMVYIRIVGLASLDGRIGWNERIAGARARALKQFIADRTRTPDTLYEVINGGEDWADFRDMIAESDYEHRDEVLRIIDTTPDRNRCEQLLRRMKNGTVWRELKKNYLGDFRNAGYIRMYYDNRENNK